MHTTFAVGNEGQPVSPITPADAVIHSGVPDSVSLVTPADAIIVDAGPASAEHVVNPEQRVDNNFHGGLIRRFLQASAEIEG